MHTILGCRMGRVAVLLLALALMLAACGGGGDQTGGATGAPGPGTGGGDAGDAGDTGSGGSDESGEKVLTIGMWSAPGNFSPINADSTYAYYVVGIVYDTLVAQTPELT
ncbi:MAG TPA: hypothetical protein VF282_04695, partial [Bacillota bacterium]